MFLCGHSVTSAFVRGKNENEMKPNFGAFMQGKVTISCTPALAFEEELK